VTKLSPDRPATNGWSEPGPGGEEHGSNGFAGGFGSPVRRVPKPWRDGNASYLTAGHHCRDIGVDIFDRLDVEFFHQYGGHIWRKECG